MNSLLQDLSEHYNLSIRNRQGWGNVDGYWFQIEVPPNSSQPLKIKTALQYPDEASAGTLDMSLAAIKRDDPNLSFARMGAVLSIGRSMPFPAGRLKAQDVESMLLKITVAFRQAGVTPACFHCHERSADGFAMVNGEAVKLCSPCMMELEHAVVQKTEEYKEIENNYLKGAAGALLGALVGSIAWILLGMLGRVAAIGGFAISFCAFKGYTLMKGKVTKLAVLIICLVSIVVMVLAQFVTYDIVMYNEAVKAGYQAGFGEVTKLTWNIILKDSEVMGEFIRNCLLGLLFLALGSYSIIKPLFSHAKAPAGQFERL